MLRLLPGIYFLLISTLPVHPPAFFPKPLPIFPVFAVANTWFLCRARRIKKGTLLNVDSRVECPRNINRLFFMTSGMMTCEMSNLEI